MAKNLNTRDTMVRYLANIDWFNNAAFKTIDGIRGEVNKQDVMQEAKKLYLQDEVRKYEGKSITPEMAIELANLVGNGWNEAGAETTSAYRMFAIITLFKEKISLLNELLESYQLRCPHTLVNTTTCDTSDGYACKPNYVTSHRCRICGKGWEDGDR